MYLIKRLTLIAVTFISFLSTATEQHIDNVEIVKIRSVGNFTAGEVFDNTIELWFTNPLIINSNMNCSATFRIMINAEYTHMVSIAMMAMASGKKVSINLDDTLPIRDGACEISYIDINK